MRLFIGTFLDSKLTKMLLIEDIEKAFVKNLKNIKQENIHMTWIFLGDIEASKQSFVEEIINQNLKIFKGLSFRSNKLEFWPLQKKPRLIVLTGELNKAVDLSSLSNDLTTVCHPDIKSDFIPHITIGRFKKDETVNKHTPLPIVEPFDWNINEISLIQSTLTNEGPTYQKLYNWDISL